MLKSVREKAVKLAKGDWALATIIILAVLILIAGLKVALVYFAWNTICEIFALPYVITVWQSFGVVVAGWLVKSFFRKEDSKVELNKTN